MVGLPPEQLDDWLPDPALRVAHRMSSPASPAELWRSARALTLSQSPVLGRLVQWRIPGTARELTFDALLREPPFLVLAEDERWLLSGLVGRIWTLRRDYPALPDPASFRGFAQRGSARVAIGVWAEDDPRGGALCAEARVEALGAQGQLGVAAVRPLVIAFQHLIGSEALRAAAQRAEARGA
ncbi:MAG TPA: hypothetical protein VKV21_01780 [Solirubrobacteraceae bacterium]|nr:hypothetical protein [Solirubrobacteraceae bacterium]